MKNLQSNCFYLGLGTFKTGMKALGVSVKLRNW